MPDGPYAAEARARGRDWDFDDKPPSSSEMVEVLRREQEQPKPELDGSPESMPEVDRELTILGGACDGVRRRAAELVGRLESVLPGDGAEQVMAAVSKSAESSRESPSMGVETAVGRRVRRVQQELHDVETALAVLTHLVRL